MHYTILVVDDEERMRKLIGAYLKKEGYEVLEAENGLEALTVFKSVPVHLLILDVMMPAMDGWTTCTELRKISNVPIIMLTAKGEDEDKLLGFELGTDHYLTKPFNIKLLLANVKSLINRVYFYESPDKGSGALSPLVSGQIPLQRNGREKKELSFDGLEIDELSHRVTVNGEEIALSPKEYDLLLYCSINHGIVLSREKILDAIWGMDFYGDLRTVDTYIKRLREKLGEKACLLSTIRGTGYRFEVSHER